MRSIPVRSLNPSWDGLRHAIRAITDANPQSIDGIGAYDHVLRSAMLRLCWWKSHSSRGWFLLSGPSTHFRHVMRGKMSTVPVGRWCSTREARETRLCLFCSAQFFVRSEATPLAREHLFAFLDDVYVVCMPERTITVHDLGEKLLEGVGIRLHIGKTRVWNQAGKCPRNGRLRSPQGMKISGPRSAQRHSRKLRAASALKRKRSCGTPLHLGSVVRLEGVGPVCWSQVPPSVAHHASTTFSHVSASPTTQACNVPCCPFLVSCWERRATRGGVAVGVVANAHGGASDPRLAAPAFWASWADALPMFQKRLPELLRLSTTCPKRQLFVRGLLGSVERS